MQLSPRPFSFLIQKRLVSQSLFKKEKEALSRPRDPIPQAELYRSLNDHGLPHLVLSRIQTQKGIARDHFLILREWIKAFISVRTGGRASPSDVGITLDEMVSARKMTLVQDYGALIRQMNSLDGYPTFIKSAIVGTIRFFKSAIVFSIFLLGIATTFESGISTCKPSVTVVCVSLCF